MSLAHIDRSPVAATVSATGNEWIALMQPAAELAGQIANTDFVPTEFRNKPAAIAACILFGAELGIGPMVSLTKIDIVKGRPAPRAELGRALALAAGHEVWVEESTNTRVTVSGKRRGSSHVQTVTWTMDDAKRAGIAGNPTYAKYPRQMLLARASAELVRAICPEVLGGITVFAEEAVDIDDSPVAAVVEAPAAEKVRATTTRKRAAKPEPSERQPEAPPANSEASSATGAPFDSGMASSDADVEKPSAAQTKMAMAEFAEVGITERDDRLAATAAFVGHPVGSWSDLNRDEASSVIDGLERVKAGTVSFVIADDGTWALSFVDGDEPALPGDDWDGQ